MPESEQITVYQLKIFILGISPMIWRQFKVHSNSTITDLHYIIQIVMGRTDSQASFACVTGYPIRDKLRLKYSCQAGLSGWLKEK